MLLRKIDIFFNRKNFTRKSHELRFPIKIFFKCLKSINWKIIIDKGLLFSPEIGKISKSK